MFIARVRYIWDMIVEKFYRLLGHYLYAIALSDGRINSAEEDRLEKMMTDVWSLDSTQELPEVKNVFLAKSSFNNSLRTRMHWPAGKQAFLEFLKSHGHDLARSHKESAILLIRSMAAARCGYGDTESPLVVNAWKLLEPNNNLV